ncbi:hypothetical protein MERGE_002688 [Pneumocystis wakefieldiae]|uniref:Multifunctional fusion protein n=1 Tax=Pneumocystis wakefieldiae TaxID=38082 RepID=A0A899G200_9ASCO|nr:hypothetical protein MERGE_002688 [Pneumocystis wakefieldiae]
MKNQSNLTTKKPDFLKDSNANSNPFIYIDSQEDTMETISKNINTYTSNERNSYTSTLEEPIYMTIYNDLKMIGIRAKYILLPHKDSNILRNWDLWGPFIFCLIFSLCLSLKASKNESINVFTGIFCIIWVSELVITLNLKLLKVPISMFQSLCILGYSLFPFVICTILNFFIHTTFIRFLLIIVAYVWSTYASLNVINDFSFVKRNILVIYPLLLYITQLFDLVHKTKSFNNIPIIKAVYMSSFADKYVEFDYVIITIDLMLIKPQPYIVRFWLLLILFDVYLMWLRADRQSEHTISTSTSSQAIFSNIEKCLYFLIICLLETISFHWGPRILARHCNFEAIKIQLNCGDLKALIFVLSGVLSRALVFSFFVKYTLDIPLKIHLQNRWLPWSCFNKPQ